MQSPLFLCFSCVKDEKCLICSQNLDNRRNFTILVEKCEKHQKLQAANSQKINIPRGHDYYYCTNVYEKIKDFGYAFDQELIKKYLTFNTQKSKTNMAKK